MHVFIHVLPVLASFMIASGKIAMELRAIDCTDVCQSSGDFSCKSSIKINNQENSQQMDGLNIAVIDSSNGNIIKTKNVDELSGLFKIDLFDRRKTAFVNFFKDITGNALVILVSQDMCSIGYDDWFEYLKEHVDMFEKLQWPAARYQQTGIIVACVGECPETVLGSLPYIHFNTDPWYTTEISFIEKDSLINTTPKTIQSTSTPKIIEKSNLKSNTKTPLIIGIVFSTLVVLICVILLFLFIYRKQYFKCTKRDKSEINENEQELTGLNQNDAVDFNNHSYSKQKHLLHLTPQTQYYNTKMVASASIPTNEYACLNDHTQTDKPLNQYDYITPVKDELEAENNYYSPAVETDLTTRCRSETELTNLSNESSIAVQTLNKDSKQDKLLACDTSSAVDKEGKPSLYHSLSDDVETNHIYECLNK